VLHKIDSSLEAEKFATAMQIIQGYLDTNPEPSDYRIFERKARIHALGGKNAAAAAAYAKAVGLCDEQDWLWQNYAVICWDLERYACAAEAFFRAYELNYDSSIRYQGIVALSHAGEAEDAAQKLRDLIATANKVPAEWIKTYAHIAMQAEKTLPALEAFRTWEKRFHHLFSYWHMRAYLHMEQKDYPAAVSCLRVADSLKPLADKERGILADLLLNLDLPLQAAQQYRQLLEKDSVNPKWHRQLVLSLRMGANTEEALAALEQAREFVPREDYLRQKGELEYDREEYASAFKTFAALLKNGSGDARLHLLQGICALNLGKYSKARKHLQKARKSRRYRNEAAAMLKWLDQAEER
jgi:tetratricopeptide (TPR) repeat protein